MKTPPPDRPPTILSEYGEGYCRACRFIEPLNENGLIAFHGRGGVACDGIGARPPKVTPYASRLSAFRSKLETVRCPACGRTVRLLVDGRMVGHRISDFSLTYCDAR